MLTRSFDTSFDLAVCRRLVTEGCAFQGKVPTTALDAVRARGGLLGDVLVVDVGYNEGSSGYRQGMRRIIRAGVASGEFAAADERRISLHVLSLLNWTYQWYDPSGTWNADDLAEQFFDILMRGLEPR